MLVRIFSRTDSTHPSCVVPLRVLAAIVTFRENSRLLNIPALLGPDVGGGSIRRPARSVNFSLPATSGVSVRTGSRQLFRYDGQRLTPSQCSKPNLGRRRCKSKIPQLLGLLVHSNRVDRVQNPLAARLKDFDAGLVLPSQLLAQLVRI
jgi:hypothetical protein